MSATVGGPSGASTRASDPSDLASKVSDRYRVACELSQDHRLATHSRAVAGQEGVHRHRMLESDAAVRLVVHEAQYDEGACAAASDRRDIALPVRRNGMTRQCLLHAIDE